MTVKGRIGVKGIAALLAAAACACAYAAPFKANFRTNGKAAVSGKTLVADHGDKQQSSEAHAQVRIPDEYIGKTFSISVNATGEGLSNPKKLKFRLTLGNNLAGEAIPVSAKIGAPDEVANGTARLTLDYPAYGSSAWGTLTLGADDTKGKVTFDLGSMEIEAKPDMFPQVNKDWKCEYSPRVMDGVRRRGAMLGIIPAMTVKDIEDLAAYGANCARYQMWHGDVKRKEGEEVIDFFHRWLDKRLDHLVDVVLPAAKRLGMKICVDLHDTPGYRNGSENRMFTDPVKRDQLVDAWRKIARRLKGHGEIYGYDLYNEPVQSGYAVDGCDYWTCQYKCIEAIREIDPDTPIIVESNHFCSAKTYAYMSPFPFKDIIYEVHFYEPHNYTHQGVGARKKEHWNPVPYVNWNRKGVKWGGKEYLRKMLNAARAFEKRHGAKIYVGEFSSICWAPDNERWLADAISLFEEYGWDWTFHAYREWIGWSFEHEAKDFNRMERRETGPRKVVLTDGFKGKVHDLSINWKFPKGAQIDGPKVTLRGGQIAEAEIDMSPYVDTTVELSVKTAGKNLETGRKLHLSLEAYNEWMEETETTDGWNRETKQFTNGTDVLKTHVPMYKMRPGKGKLRFGLKDTKGSATFDISTFRMRWVPDMYPQVHQDHVCEYTERVTGDVRRRGCMLGISPALQDKDFADLAKYGANIVRYQMWNGSMRPHKGESRADFWDRWHKVMIDNLETNVLVAAKKYGFKVVVDLHDSPGCRQLCMPRMFFEKDPKTGERTQYFVQFTNSWAQVAKRFKGNECIYGYDLYNEPVQDVPSPVGQDYWTCSYAAAKAIRDVDPEVPIIVECGDWDNSKGFRYMSPLPFKNVIYSLHFYCPHHYTHQGVGPNAMTGPYRKAAKVGAKSEGIGYLRRRMAAARKFSAKHKAKMYVGEFSVGVFAPEGGEWLDQTISLFEENGWDWTYHAFREWTGWSFEHEYNPKTKKIVPSADNDRKRTLLKYFRLNKKSN